MAEEVTAMRGLTLHRPWDEAIVRGEKTIENRPWKPWPKVIGERIAIHAGKKYDHDAAAWIRRRGVRLFSTMDSHRTRAGAVVGVARVVGYVTRDKAGNLEHAGLSADELAAALDSPWGFGPVRWVLADAVPIEPIPHPGALALWRVPDGTGEDERNLLEELEDRLERPWFVCAGCRRLMPYEDGAADDMPDHCARCWEAAQ